MYPARTSTTNRLPQRSSTSYSLESTDGDVFDCSARWRSLRPMAHSARCDVRRGAAVFVGSDETTIHVNSSVLDGFRRLLLQIGGANIASADRAL
jgi:hypothetical protein